MTADERIEALLNRAGQTISDLPEGYAIEDLFEMTRVAESRFHGAFRYPLYICHLADVIDRMETALHNALGERDALRKDLEEIVASGQLEDECVYCAHHENTVCEGEKCPHFISGVGAENPDGEQFPDFKWTCEDFRFGTCPKMENTPCNGCDFRGPLGMAGRALKSGKHSHS